MQITREIIFKAKRKDNGEWVEGGYFSEPYTDKKLLFVGTVLDLDLMNLSKLLLIPSASTQGLPTRTVRRFMRMIF